MQQMIDFIIRKKDVLVYFVLLFFSIAILLNSNYFHKSKIILIANNISNFTTERFMLFNEFFDLKNINKKLIAENLNLKNELEKIKSKPFFDTISSANFSYQNAKIISNNLSSFKNNLVIDKGIKDGLSREMGVINKDGVVGIITNISSNYSYVMSILNIDSKINAKVKRTNHFGTLQWNGLNTNYVQLIDISETANIKVGDSIVTGGMSLIFPEGIDIGIISKIDQFKINSIDKNFTNKKNNKLIEIESAENYFDIEIKLHADMSNLKNVYVIESLNIKEFKEVQKND
ncbi:MAG: rod shape-determining protein MreC [Flavobacteriaceae bacterium]|nr:rod shape-determining protein MreC [Flavobacteriaceae bacterium]